MTMATGTVRAGKVVLDEPLSEGAAVWVVTRAEKEIEIRLSFEELAELEAGIAEADRGEMIPGEELFARLRRHE